MSDGSPVPTRRKPAPSDVIGTALVGIVGAVALVIGLGYGFLEDDGQVGAGFLPVVTGSFILVASLAELARMYFAEPASRGLMSLTETAEQEAKAAIADHKEQAGNLDNFGRTAHERNLAIIKVFGLLLGALVLIPVIGLLLSLTTMVLAIVLWVERKPLVPAVLSTAGVLGLAYLIFIELLGVPAPQGMLGLI